MPDVQGRFPISYLLDLDPSDLNQLASHIERVRIDRDDLELIYKDCEYELYKSKSNFSYHLIEYACGVIYSVERPAFSDSVPLDWETPEIAFDRMYQAMGLLWGDLS